MAMFMPSNEVWGIDIGKSALKAVKMRRVKDQVEIIAIDVVEYSQPADTENVDRDAQVRQALIEFQTRNKVKNDRIYASIPGQATFNRLITIPPVEAKRIKEIVTYEAQQQIPFPINEVLWDYQLIGGVKEKTVEEREVMLFAVRREIINNFLNNLSNAQLNVEGIQIAPLALYNFMRYERPELTAAVAVDIGAENTDLVVVDAEKLWLRALPAAGNDITKALQKRFNIPYSEAEQLKLKAGKTRQAKKIFDVMKPILKDIVGEIHRSVGFYKSMAKDIKFQRMVFMGNVTKLTEFDKFFEQNLQYEIEILSEVKNIRISPKINVNLFQTNIPSFAVAMGLAIQGVGLSVNKIRLLPEEIPLQQALQRQKPALAVAVGLLAIIPFFLAFQKKQLVQEAGAVAKEVQTAIAPIAEEEEAYKRVLNYDHIKQRLDMLTQVGTHRGIWIAITEAINSILLDNSQKIKDQNAKKIWILDTEMESGLDQYLAKDRERIILDEKVPYISVVIKVAFETMGDEVRNLDYAETNLRKPLESIKYGSNELFAKCLTNISLETKEILFPGDMRSNQQICHVTLKLFAYMDKFATLELDSKLRAGLDRQNEQYERVWKDIRAIFEKNQIPLSPNVRPQVEIRNIFWKIIDRDNKNLEYHIYTMGNDSPLRVYRIVK